MNSSRWTAAILSLLLFAVGVPACFAQGGPPVITDDPGTPGNHHWEINVAYTQETRTGVTNLETPIFDFNYGVGDRLQLKFEIPYAVQTAASETRTGLGNSRVGTKWRFLEETKYGISVSTYPQFTFNNPTSSVRRGIVDDGLQMFLPVEVSKTVGRFQAGGEVGYNFRQKAANELWLGVVGAFQAASRVQLLTELHSIETGRFAGNESVFDLGGRVKLTNLNTLLFAAGRSLPGSTDGQPKFFMYAGIQFSF
jgi:hypothetical protein